MPTSTIMTSKGTQIPMPKFEETPISDIDAIVNRHHQTFASGRTRPLEFRLNQLRRLYWKIVDMTPQIQEACRLDLDKGAFEAYMTEISWVKNDIIFTEQNLAKWMKDESPEDIPLANKVLRPRIRKDPLGTALVIGAFNFPFQLALGPLIGAMAAGCCCVMKPSENAPASAAVLHALVSSALDPACYSVVNGGIPQTRALLDTPRRWDVMFYTGGKFAGEIVAAAAAKTLTPVVLELGGQNPAFVTKNANVQLAARRLLWAKTFNSGQVCVGQNWTLVERSILPEFLEQIKIEYKRFYPDGPMASKDYGRIINERGFDRLAGMLERSKGEVIIGGQMDRSQKFIAPTVVLVKDVNDSLVQEESFGPLLPIMAFDDLDKAIDHANQVHETPLAVYPFGNDREVERILSRTRSGGATINDGYFHASVPTLQFGGVGTSGSGAYRGRASFDCFTHRRSIVKTPTWFERMLDIRYPPYTAKKASQFETFSDLKPAFGRDFKPHLLRPGSWASYLTLGSTSIWGIFVRCVFIALLVFASKDRLQKVTDDGRKSVFSLMGK